MRIEDIHVGDRLRIRQWDDMKAEFGTDKDEDIDCRFCFSKSMRYLCGKEFTVAEIDGPTIVPAVSPDEHDDPYSGYGGFFFSADMLEPYPERGGLISPAGRGIAEILFGGE